MAPQPIKPLGAFLVSCVTALLNSPAVVDAFRLRRHWEHSALGLVFPNGCPIRVLRAIDALDAGINAAQIEKLNREKKT